MVREARVILPFFVLFFLLGCGGGGGISGGGAGGGSTPTITSVTASCSPSSITTIQTSTCTATVSGSGSYSTDVAWTASIGSIGTSGVFTPSTAGVATITATSTQDPAKSGTATISLTNPVPSITGISPSAVMVGASDTTVALSGDGFAPSSSASVDGESLTTRFESATSLQTIIPSSVLASAKLHLLSVANPAPGGGATGTAGPWKTTGMMTTPRSGQTQTVLQDGKVLEVGGGVISGLVYNIGSSAETYNPVSSTFSVSGSMASPRIYHTATLLQNGKVLVAGGSGSAPNGSVASGAVASAEIFDPASGAFTPTGSMTQPRAFHTATLLTDGRVLITGGAGSKGIIATAEIYDPSSGQFTATASMSVARAVHVAALLTNGNVLITGGETTNGTDLKTAEIYDPGAAAFTQTGSLQIGRETPTAVLLVNGKVLIAGGYQYPNGALQEAEIYDPAAGVFSSTGSMGSPRNLHDAVLLSDGTVLIVGGNDGSIYLSGAELYNPTSGLFTATWSLALARESFGATALQDGSVLVAGGLNAAGNPSGSAEVLAPPSSTTASLGAVFTVNNPVPSIASLSPNPAPAGSAVVLIGSNFGSNHEIVANGFAVPSYTNALGSNQSWFYPNAAGSYTVAINNPSPGGGISNTLSLQVHVAIGITPARALWAPGSTNTFSATVLGTTNKNVTWNVVEGTSGGVVDSSGKYTAPTVSGTYHIVATSQADPTQTAQATVIVNPGAGSMAAGPQLVVPRSGHTATLLPSGRVLLAGGDLVSGAEGNTAEVYDPTANSFVLTGSMSTGRYGHSAVLLPTGKVLVICGNNGQYPSTPSQGAELYDPNSGAFSFAGSMVNPARDTCSAAPLPNGKALIVGGVDANGNASANAEIYDPSNGSFAATGSMTVPRLQASAILLKTGKVLVAGGGGHSGSLSSAELFDPASGTFTATGSMTVPRQVATAVLLNDGRVMIMGQYTGCGGPADVYDPATGVFSQTATAPLYMQGWNVAGATLSSGLGFVVGGLLQTCTINGSYASQTEFFNSNDESFYAGPLMSYPRWKNTMTPLQDGRLLIAGGIGYGVDSTGSGQSSDLYTPGATNPLPASATKKSNSEISKERSPSNLLSAGLILRLSAK